MAFDDGDLAYRINFATADVAEIVDRRVGRDLSSEEAHALAEEVNEQLTLPARDLRARGHDRAPRRARDPDRRGTPVGQRDQHRPRVSARGAPRRGARDVRAGRRDVRRRSTTREAARARGSDERVRRGRGSVLDASRRERRAAGRGQLPGQPDPHPRRRRSPAPAPADPRPVRVGVGLLRRDAGRARDLPRPRDGRR